MAKERVRTIKGYMCGVDWQHELGEAMGGNVVYPSVDDLKKHRKCVKNCGIVEVKVQLSKWVEPQDLFRGEKIDVPETE